jgi:hypothetical protein
MHLEKTISKVPPSSQILWLSGQIVQEILSRKYPTYKKKKTGGWVAQVVEKSTWGPEFKPQCRQKTKPTKLLLVPQNFSFISTEASFKRIQISNATMKSSRNIVISGRKSMTMKHKWQNKVSPFRIEDCMITWTTGPGTETNNRK